MIKYPGRISRAKARGLWQKGEPFIITGAKFRSDSFLAMTVDPERYKAEGIGFNEFVASYVVFNLNYETGYYPAFYEVAGGG